MNEEIADEITWKIVFDVCLKEMFCGTSHVVIDGCVGIGRLIVSSRCVYDKTCLGTSVETKLKPTNAYNILLVAILLHATTRDHHGKLERVCNSSYRF